jgi:hypothetical protein
MLVTGDKADDAVQHSVSGLDRAVKTMVVSQRLLGQSKASRSQSIHFYRRSLEKVMRYLVRSFVLGKVHVSSCTPLQITSRRLSLHTILFRGRQQIKCETGMIIKDCVACEYTNPIGLHEHVPKLCHGLQGGQKFGSIELGVAALSFYLSVVSCT